MSLLQDLKTTPRLGILTGITAAAVGIIYGYDMSNIAGALGFLEIEFDLSTQALEQITTAVVIGEVLGALIGGWLANKVGRRTAMIGVATGYALFAILSALAPTVPVLYVARLLLGLTIGVSVVVVPVFVAESSPAKIRGALLVAYQVTTVIGVILGYVIAYFLSGAGNWRMMLGLAAVPAVVVLLIVVRLPDTPRWYMMKGREEEARNVLNRIEGEGSLNVALELAQMSRSLREESGGAIREMLRKPFLRATIFVVGLGFFIQITGINAIVYYSPKLFALMGFEGHASQLLLPALVQGVSLIAVFFSLSLVDRIGRRPILLGGIGTMIAANILLIAIFLISDDFGGILTALGFTGVLLFTVGFTFGFGALVWVYAGESFPAHLRALGSSAMLTSDLLANVVVSMFFLSMLQQLGGAGTFMVFGALAVLAFIFVLRMAPETKGRNLEDIREFWENGGRWEVKN